VTTELPAQPKLAIIIQQGKVLDFIDGKTQRQETPEEYVRQEIAKSLVRNTATRRPTSKSNSLSGWAPASRVRTS